MEKEQPLKRYKTYKWLVKDSDYVNGRIAIRGTRLQALTEVLQVAADALQGSRTA